MQSVQQPRVVTYGRKRHGRRKRARRRRLTVLVALVIGILLLVVDPALIGLGHGSSSGSTLTPLQERIVSIAQNQIGYHSDPSDTYCNRFSAYWQSGTADCGNGNRDEEWCADFAAWVWRQAGVPFVYQFINGDINSSSASFYEWGVAQGTWHPYGSGYVPEPGDVAVYGLDTTTLVAVHVAIVISNSPGARGPNVVNGDGDHSGFSVVETGTDQYFADTHSNNARLAGFVSPTPTTSG